MSGTVGHVPPTSANAPRITPPAEGLRRSVALFRAFRVEQSDPDRFYGELAADSARQVGQFADLAGATVLDVGGGPGYFASAFRAAGATYLAVDASLGELSAREAPGPTTVLGSGLALPVRDDAVDVCYSSNVLEHVADPTGMLAEMLRVTRPGGTVFVSYTLWLSPWGGHETSPWHYVGGAYAARRYERRHGHQPKNVYGTSLFPLSAGAVLRWARRQREADMVAAFPRYHPRWAHWVMAVPGIRELLSWNLVIVLRVR